MSDVDKQNTASQVACEICLKEIPSSEAKMEEASDYVMYFCGLECYQQWREKADKNS